MKKLVLPLLVFASLSAQAQNALLKSAATGTVAVKDIEAISMASDGTDVVLIAADKTGIYAIDIADNDKTKVVANLITAVPNFVTSKLEPVAGGAVTVRDMEVNPVSKSIYILASANSGTNKYIFKVEDAGSKVTMVNLANVKYSKMGWGTTLDVTDMAFGNNTLYVASGSFSLDGELGWIAPPFTHNTSFAKRATTMFKSNWGGTYVTKAPLDVLAFGNIAGKNRLMGVTTCAPGFSIDVATLTGPGVLSITEDFNVNSGMSTKATYMNHDKKDWLFTLHDGKVYRIGKKYLDGSQVVANQHNNNATLLRTMTGQVPPSMPADEMKEMIATTISTMAQYDNYRLILLESHFPVGTGTLKMTQVSTETPAPVGVADVAPLAAMNIYPNPATSTVTITLPAGETKAMVDIVSINGQVVYSQEVADAKAVIDVNNLPSGLYTVNMKLAGGRAISGKLTVE